MIIDFHAHLGREPFADQSRLRNEYARAGVTHGVLVPGGMIDMRRMSAYITGDLTPGDPVPDNELVERLFLDDESFYGFYCVDPHTARDGVATFERALGRGFRGLKLAPLVHQFSLTSDLVRALLDVCNDAGCPVYTHTTYSPAASTRKVGVLAASYPAIPFIIGHMGFGPADADAIALAVRYENVFLETSGGSFLALEQAVAAAGPEKLLFGSEFPLHNPLAELRKLETLDLCSADFERVTRDNALALLSRQYSFPQRAQARP